MRHQQAMQINDQWRFSLHAGNLTGSMISNVVASDWPVITLPHSWNAFDTMEIEPGQHYRRAGGWYVRNFQPPPEGQRLWVEFEAAAQRASLWCNGRSLGEHAGGYTAFTRELLPDKEQLLTLALRVDNLPDPDLIPSDLSDFFLYGGLTRNAWSYTTGPRRITSLRCESEVTADEATLSIRGQLDAPPPQTLQVQATVYTPAGTLLTRIKATITEETFTLSMPRILSPELWSPAHPALYTLHVHIGVDAEIWDSVVEHIGLRFFAFPFGGPLLLNGEAICLYGTHRHEDWAGYASAIPDELTRQEMRQIKQAGFNFVRLGHYPQAPAVLDACDELGLLVWEELPWCRGGIGGERFRTQARAMLDEMIEQHYNHPSLLFWGLGNELDWESEHPDSSDEKICDFLRELHKRSHELDTQRLTALRRFEPGSRIVDVYSPSLWSGWYRGRYEDYADALHELLTRYPRMLHIEWGGDSHYGRHRVGQHIAGEVAHERDHAERPGIAVSMEGPARASRDSDWSESYMLDLMEWHLQVQLRTPQLVGNAQWVFKDFGTPLRPENPVPYVNQKGLVDRAGRPKDLYYLFQSYLTTTPMCYIESPTWLVRVGAADEMQRVRIYSNCPRVALFVNGVDYGQRERDGSAFPAAGLCWWVYFQPGQNTLRAIGTAPDGRRVEHQIVQEYCVAASGPDVTFRWQLAPTRTTDGLMNVHATIQLVDAAGNPGVDDRRRVAFALQGEGQLCDRLGTVDGSCVVELTNGSASILVISVTPSTTLLVSAAGIDDVAIPITW